MQEWLKDKKNLPIVAALMVFVLLGAGGLIAFELGAFSQQASAPPSPSVPAGIPGGPPVGAGSLPVGTGGPPLGRPPLGGRRPGGGRPGLPTGLPHATPATTAAAAGPVTPKSDSVNPLIGPDPFKIPGGAQKYVQIQQKLAPPKLALRNVIGPLDLFQIRPPTPPQTPQIAGGPGQTESNPASNYRLSGLVNGPDGNNAILEVGGQSQSVKPGDTLADGTSVQSIQSTSVTLKSPSGSVFILQLSAGSPDQAPQPFNGQPQYPGGFNSQPQVN